MKTVLYYGMGLLVLFALFLFPLSGCEEKEEQPKPKPQADTGPMVRVAGEDWPDFEDDLDPASLFNALAQSRVYLNRVPGSRVFEYGPDRYTAAELLDSLDTFEKLYRTHERGTDLKEALVRNFILYQSVGSDTDHNVLCTGYYEPELQGSLTPSDQFKWPVYGLPGDLITVDLGLFDSELKGKTIRGRIEGRSLKPYFSRREIDREGRLNGRALELGWVADPVALFFLHIQGSGRISLDGGDVLRVGYAGANGRAYRSLGKYMIETERLAKENVSMQSIRAYLDQHPEEMAELLDYNASYVFFRVLDGDAVGNINVPLTPLRSVALDYRIFPKSALAWLQCRKPVVADGNISDWRPFSRFVMVQDTGGAIRGPGRLDLFWGHGTEAEISAGHMKENGRLYFLVKKQDPPH